MPTEDNFSHPYEKAGVQVPSPGTDGRPPEDHEPSPGYELSDVNVRGTLVFIAGLLSSCVVIFIVCWAMGKVFFAEFKHEDGPISHWRQGGPQDAKGNLISNAEIQQKASAQLVETFPTPRVQADDGNQDVADLHAREDLYLEHYSWVDAGHTAVRIPIERAMQLLVQRGLPVAPAAQADTGTFTGEQTPVVTAPLTTGFARTAFEQEDIQTRREKMGLTAEPETHSDVAAPSK
jgi:hypothetical protein